MAKLHFKYGALNSSKTANLLMTAHNYREKDSKVLLLQSSKNIRTGASKITSRVGLESDCIVFNDNTNLKELILNREVAPEVVLIDEIQFATVKQVDELVEIVDNCGITVITYGLKSTYTGDLFPATAKLFVVADKIEEIKQICMFCDKKAFMNLKVKDNKPVYSGEIISIGDVKQSKEYYIPVCRKHFYNPPIWD